MTRLHPLGTDLGWADDAFPAPLIRSEDWLRMAALWKVGPKPFRCFFSIDAAAWAHAQMTRGMRGQIPLPGFLHLPPIFTDVQPEHVQGDPRVPQPQYPLPLDHDSARRLRTMQLDAVSLARKPQAAASLAKSQMPGEAV